MKHKVCELDGYLLDAAVAKALADPRISMWGDAPWIEDGGGSGHGTTGRHFKPSTQWEFGGPIIERERIALEPWQYDGEWQANGTWGPTPLIAAMRAYVASKLGDEIELP